MRQQRIVYLQYTNPAGYPPLEHSSRILADAGWEVLFLSSTADGARSLQFAQHSAIRVMRLPKFGNGILQKLNYCVYLAWALVQCLVWRPRWVYASDPMSCPAALLVRSVTRCQVVYHEHDTPSYNKPLSIIQRLFQTTRAKLVRSADLLILPQKERLNTILSEAKRSGLSLCVWNCPRADEVCPQPAPARNPNTPLRFYYHGSINSQRLPEIVLDALARSSSTATLKVVGYETVGSLGYMQRFLARAEALGVQDRVSYLGPMSRSEIFEHARESDVGLAFMPQASDDINMLHMVGASNKAFDYLAAGMMLMVSDLAEWRESFVEPGYGIACDPTALEKLAAAFSWCANHPTLVRAMGEAGRQRVASEWNYEKQFRPAAIVLAKSQ
jgi:glycosyltransferase involved in cell wall biosynthesis